MPRGLPNSVFMRLMQERPALFHSPMFKYLVAGAIAAYALYQSFAGDRDDRPPSRSPSYEPYQPPADRQPSGSRSYESASQPPLRRRDERQQRETIDSSQRDYTPVEAWATLRARAGQEGDLRSQCFRQSKEAYERRDHALAKALSEKGKRHASKMENLNAKASALIFAENNKDKDADEVDLHNLYVKEAIAYSQRAITKARQGGHSEIRLIVGQGNHSDGGISRLKPAIQEDMQERGFPVEVDPRNPGVLVVQLSRW